VARYVCPKCGNTGPGAFRFDARTGNIRCRRCGAVAEFQEEDVTPVTSARILFWLVGWDLSGVDPADRRRFYRELRQLLTGAHPNTRKPLYSLLETSDSRLAHSIYNRVRDIGGRAILRGVSRVEAGP